MTTEILFEDNHLLLLNKPAGLLTQPSGTDRESLECLAKRWLKERDQKPGNVFLSPVHRLDKPVSGLVLFAKTGKALSRLNAAMRLRQFQKTYWAWVLGSPTSAEGTLEHCLMHDHFQAQLLSADHPKGKRASLHYRVLRRMQERSLLEITLGTGRYHQIRLQLSSIGHPVWGDAKYGGNQTYPRDSIALHHRSLHWVHPVAHSPMAFEAPPPHPFEALGQ